MKRIKGFIRTGASDLARAAMEAGKGLVLELHKILDEVKNVTDAERLATRRTKAGKFDITRAKMFFEDGAVNAQVVAAVQDKLAEMAFGGVNFFVLVRYVLLVLFFFALTLVSSTIKADSVLRQQWPRGMYSKVSLASRLDAGEVCIIIHASVACPMAPARLVDKGGAQGHGVSV